MLHQPTRSEGAHGSKAVEIRGYGAIQKTMAHIKPSRTVLIIAHRLSAVRNANSIIVMDMGQIVEMGLHDVLVQKPNGLYAHMWAFCFRGRFKAVVVQRESYLLELARYVVLNPVRAGMCALPQDWPWSRQRVTMGTTARSAARCVRPKSRVRTSANYYQMDSWKHN